MVKCDNCGKRIGFFSYRGYDIKGKLLCESCWKQLIDEEKDLMFNIKTKKAYEKNKAKLLKKANSLKLNLKRKEPKIKDEKYCFLSIIASIFTSLSFIIFYFLNEINLSWCILSYFLGIIFGIIALIKIKENPHLKGKFLAWFSILFMTIILLIGIILGIIRGLFA